MAASRLAAAAGDPARAALYLATADDYQRNVKAWTVTSTGPDGTGRYFIREAVTGHPNTGARPTTSATAACPGSTSVASSTPVSWN